MSPPIPAHDGAHPEAGAPRFRQGNLLVVDDSLSFRLLMTEVLTQAGHRVHGAEDGVKGLEATKTLEPDLILLDSQMPGMDGFEVLQHLKADPATRHIPVICVSAADDLESRIRGLRLGAVDYVAKTFDREELLARLQNHLELVQTRRELNRTQAILQAAMDQSSAGIAIADAPSGDLRYVNAAGLGIRGGGPEDLVEGIQAMDYVASWQLLDLDGRPLAMEEVPLARAVLFGETSSREFIIHRGSGDDRTVLANAAPIRNAQGKVEAGVVVFTDLTERNRVQSALKDTTERLRLATRAARLGVWEWDMASGHLLWDERMFELYGRPPTTEPGSFETWRQGVHPEDLDAATRAVNETLAGEGPYDTEFRVLHSDGGVRILHAQALVTREDSGKPLKMIGVNQDVTELRATEKALRLTRLSMEKASDAIFWIRPDGSFADVNEAACRDLGWPREDLLGLRVPDVDTRYDAQRWPNHFQDLREKGFLCFESEHRRRNGSTFPVEIVANYVRHGSEEWNCAFVRDITERKQAEEGLFQLLDALEQKNQEMEDLLYAASHDLRAPLLNVRGFSDQLQGVARRILERLGGEDIPPELRKELAPLLEDRIPTALKFIQAGGNRLDTLIKGLLNLSRVGRQELRLEPLGMEKVAEKVLRGMAFQILQSRATVEVDELPPCHGDSDTLHQVLSNLLDNALKYRHPDREPRVRVGGTRQDDLCTYWVEDNGLGIEARHHARIWKIFHRLDPGGPIPGEGLGLALVKRILNRHYGRIWVESTPGIGSRFCFELPAPPS